ncbi:hypothetical protein H5410_016003 [Solanum commersonii]|uniref:Uncharacterized protein n=1 Tax=Solanum commersonii TaxID=4109 RepID=A0A9J5ZVS7_SOLCO|nr:hypothetical protein H5410_016003 [Solanum commersonii]
MLEKARRLQWIHGFSVGSNSGNTLTISHLLYANDALIFCDAKKSKSSNKNLTLMFFETSSGLKINMLKNVNNTEELAEILWCKIGLLSSTYLGIPLGAKLKFVIYGMGEISTSLFGWKTHTYQEYSR